MTAATVFKCSQILRRDIASENIAEYVVIT